MLLDGFLAAMRRLSPACIVDLGDRINSVAAGQDGVRERYVRRRLEEAGVPVYHALGNTDVEHLAKHEALAAVKKVHAAEIVDLDRARLIILDTVDPPIEGVGGAVSVPQLDWLQAALREREAPCLVFGHHPLDEPALEGHRYFAARPDLATVANRAAVRAVLQSAPAVAAVFAGHLHWTRAAELAAIPYVTIGSLLDAGYSGGEPAGAYGVVSVGAGEVEVDISGLPPARFNWRR